MVVSVVLAIDVTVIIPDCLSAVATTPSGGRTVNELRFNCTVPQYILKVALSGKPPTTLPKLSVATDCISLSKSNTILPKPSRPSLPYLAHNDGPVYALHLPPLNFL